MEKVNRLLDALNAERLLQHQMMDRYKHDKTRWEIHKEMFFSLERIIERMQR